MCNNYQKNTKKNKPNKQKTFYTSTLLIDTNETDRERLIHTASETIYLSDKEFELDTKF